EVAHFCNAKIVKRYIVNRETVNFEEKSESDRNYNKMPALHNNLATRALPRVTIKQG
ncbi:hypothetical protein J6590_096598, partial [Homalodisca vitripennis]